MQKPLLAASITLAGIFGLSTSALSQGLELRSAPSRWRVNFSEIGLPHGEDLGLLSLHYEMLDPFEALPDTFFGLGGFGAVTGERGGFFTGGFSGGWRKELGAGFQAEIGTFVGGGGGGAAPQGTGFMFRPFFAIEKEAFGLGLRLELANTNFPGGDINDTGLSFGVSIPTEMLSGRTSSGWGAPIPMDAIDFERWRIGAGILRMNPTGGSKQNSGGKYGDAITMGGIQLAAEFEGGSYIPMKAYGAIGGGVPGFAAVLSGYGLSGEFLSKDLSWQLEGLVGMGGSGDVNTGGGFLYGASAGLRWRLAENWSTHLAIGYMGAPDGNFEGNTLEFGLAWDPRMLRLNNNYDRTNLATQHLPSHEGLQDVWQASGHYKFYKPASSAHTDSGDKHKSTLQVAGVGFERHIGEHLSVLFRTAGAVEGDIGGYAEGLAGLRASYPLFESFPNSQVHLTYEIGAAGGGGVDVGSGLIHQATVGWLWSPMQGIEVGIDVGRVDAVDNGSFKADEVGFTFAFDFMRLISVR
jgi:hypothetical protein